MKLSKGITPVFDGMAEIGVFIIKRENFELIYANEKIKEIKRELYGNTALNDIFKGVDFTRIISGLNNKDSYSTSIFKGTVGTVQNVTITKAVWDNEIPVYFVTLASSFLSDFEDDVLIENRKLIKTVKKFFPMIISVNLSRNTYSMYEYDNYITKTAPAAGRFDNLIEGGVASMREDYRDIFRETFSREVLLEKFTTGGETEVYLETPQMGDDGEYHWVATHVIKVDNPYTDDILEYTFTKIIDYRKKLENKVILAKQEVKNYRSAVVRSFDRIYEIKASDCSINLVTLKDNSVRKETLPYSVSEFVKNIVLSRVVPDSREFYLAYNWYMKNKNNKEIIHENGSAFTGSSYDEWYLMDDKGEYRWEGVYVDFGDDENGDITVFIKDIDSTKKREESQKQLLKEALANAEKANISKRNFLSHMSHDMRTPMNAIMGLTSIAKTNINNTEKVEECLDKIITSSQQLLGLINGVLDISKIESGTACINQDEFSIRELTEDVKASVASLFEYKCQEFTIDLSELDNDTVISDKERIRQVLMSLVNNAIKYTPICGKISIAIKDTETSVSGINNLSVKVTDTGIGIEEKFLNKLFDPFEQESRTLYLSDNGAGLGLAITKNIIDMLDGTITVESEINKGSCFTAEFPVKIPPDKIEASANGDIGLILENKYVGKHFLVVDDNELNREIAEELLRMTGAEVTLACDGNDAVDKVFMSIPFTFDAILMDIQMPVRNGCEATRDIRSSSRKDLQDIPIIAVTANAFSDDIRDSLNSGMNAHIAKPIDIKKLISTLDKYL